MIYFKRKKLDIAPLLPLSLKLIVYQNCQKTQGKLDLKE